MPKKSTNTNLLEISQYLHDNIGTAESIDVVYFDYSKAFDQVDHRTLATKLARLSMPYLLFKSTMNFITYRKYILKVEGTVRTNSFTASSGVPQGSHCGPILYVIMCKDCIDHTMGNNVLILVYADDTKIYKIVNTPIDAQNMQQAINRLSSWSKENRLSLNATKTKHVTYTRRKTLKFTTTYYIDETRIETVDCIRDLGVLFDKSLTFTNHIQSVYKKLRFIYGMGFRFAKDILCPALLPKIVSTYVLPLIECCSSIWNQNRLGFNSKLDEFIHKATKSALGSSYRPHMEGYIEYEKRLAILHLLSLDERRKIALATLMMKLYNNLLQTSMNESIINARNNTDNNTRSRLLFRINRRLPQNSPLRIGFDVLNEFSHILSINDSPSSIKSKLKAFFHQQRNVQYQPP